jgi:hypothetical protein
MAFDGQEIRQRVEHVIRPQISVVMGVYNGARTLRGSVCSVLSQEGADFELIVVDDGSTDATTAILDELAADDGRIRIIRQKHRGLTDALIRGCAEARGDFIARQDADDVSLAGKFSRQLEAIASRPDAALVSCGTRFVGPNGEVLYDVAGPARDATDDLLTLDPARLRGPAGHGSTLFRRDLYERVGGYRPLFYFAQDLDLWIRLAEHGRYLVLSEVLYQVSVALSSISSLRRSHQVACTKIILECSRLRRSGISEGHALAEANAIRPHAHSPRAAERAAALYFVGACLRKRGDPRAGQYFRDALRAYPLHLKSALRVVLG